MVSEEEREQDGSGFRSTLWAAWAPQFEEQIIKSEVEFSLAGATLERVMKLDGDFLEHLQRDHIPYRRDLQRLVWRGSFRGHIPPEDRGSRCLVFVVGRDWPHETR